MTVDKWWRQVHACIIASVDWLITVLSSVTHAVDYEAGFAATCYNLPFCRLRATRPLLHSCLYTSKTRPLLHSCLYTSKKLTCLICTDTRCNTARWSGCGWKGSSVIKLAFYLNPKVALRSINTTIEDLVVSLKKRFHSMDTIIELLTETEGCRLIICIECSWRYRWGLFWATGWDLPLS